MSVNIIKLCVGCATVEDLKRWQTQCVKLRKVHNENSLPFHTTRMVPKRKTELLDGGSIYWVIRNVIQVRQYIRGFSNGQRDDGSSCCFIFLDPELIPVCKTSRRAFQGWRYLDPCDSPPDLISTSSNSLKEIPPKMRRELAELCLL
ncbi:MAG: hypothetical protein TECD_01039 [Hyphomicrobiaceae bacterium hypho_1]